MNRNAYSFKQYVGSKTWPNLIIHNTNELILISVVALIIESHCIMFLEY